MNRSPKLLMRAFGFLLFVSVFVATAVAQHMNSNDSPCSGPASTDALVDCLAKAKESSDANLNSLYQTVLKKLDGEDAKRLTETERLWIKYRDANCSAERALYEKGTGGYPAYLGCLEAMTRARTKELQVTYAVRIK